MVDQTRFTTVRPGIAIMRDLLRPAGFQAGESDTFALELNVMNPQVPAGDEHILVIIANRIDLKKVDRAAEFRNRNKDVLFVTMARTSPGGEQFEIDITIPFRRPDKNGAIVTVSEEMERILIEQMISEIERFASGS